MGMGWKGKDMKAEGDWLGETKKKSKEVAKNKRSK